MIQLLLVDDHTLFRKGIKRILSDCPDLQLLDEASQAEEALAHARQRHYDVVLLDIGLPGGDGIELLKCLHEEQPELPVLVLTAHDEVIHAKRALHAGARGYFTKDGPPQELIAAIREVAKGGRYIMPSLMESVLSTLKHKPLRESHELLSEREYQVLIGIALGHTVGAIAEQLAVSPKTVSTYRERLLKKTGLRTTAELIQYAVRYSLLP